MATYRTKRLEFLAVYRWCAVYPHLRAVEVHHKFGRAGELLLDMRYWRAVSRKGHRFIHNNIAEARKLGLIAEAGKWNNPRE